MRNCILLHILLVALATAQADQCTKSTTPKASSGTVKQTPDTKREKAAIESIFSKINTAANNLKTCQADISYLSVQDPDLLDTRILRTGVLYYKKQDDERSNLRIRFDTIKQDDFDPEKQREEYLFDGIWLTHINFKLEQIDKYQQSPQGKPIDVFELINHHFPLIGFSGTESMEKEFDISLKKTDDPNEAPSLILNVKADSKFKESYEKVYFAIDKCLNLPSKVVAFTPQGDESHVEFSYAKVNKKLKNTVFRVETPKDFRQNVKRLENQPSRKER